MYLSLNWLKDYVKIPASISPEDLGVKLTTHTVEIDGVEKQEDKFKNIVLGKILEIKSHPNADRLQITIVDVGEAETLSIVCGASNIKKGQIVPVALVGAVLANGMEIKKAEVRGEYSSGMLCAEDELSLGDDHSGIMILENNAKIGQNLADYLKIKDVIFEVDNKSITNRPDLWGHIGMAREIGIFLDTDTTKKFKTLINPEDIKSKKKLKLELKVEDFKLCPRYMAVGLDNIKLASSPKWLRERLIAVGIRPINNIVDISNYVMMEFGQPMHAFDYNLLSENKDAKIIIRKANKNELIKTLDDEERELDSEMLVIANHKKPIAIAGVMGAENSEINDKTSSIVFESANFNHISIRETSSKLNLRTDASMRYEKSLDPNLCKLALLRAIELTKELCPEAELATEIIDLKKYELNQGPIEMETDWLCKFLGFKIENEEIIKILTKLGFSVSEIEKHKLRITIPSWRASGDINLKEDIAEEIARIYAYDKIEVLMPRVGMKPPLLNEEKKIIKKIKEVLVLSSYFSEVYNYSFVGGDELSKMGINYDSYISLANPISKNQGLLRQSLIPGLLANVKTNQARFEEIRIFEIGNVFFDLEGDYPLDNKTQDQLPFQEKKVSLLIAQKEKNILNRSEGDLTLKLKGVLENLFENLNLFSRTDSSDLNFEFDFMENSPPWAEPERSAFIIFNNSIIGFLAKLNSETEKKLGLKKDVLVLELSLNKIREALKIRGQFKFREFEKFPASVRDLAFVLGEKIVYKDLKNDIINFHDYIKNVDLFDIYSGEKLGSGKKSLAFHIVYQAPKTLIGKEVDQIQKELISFLEKKYEAQIRDF